jgi:hypothetical protein
MDKSSDDATTIKKEIKLRANHVEDFPLQQAWLETQDEKFREGRAELNWTSDALNVEAVLTDDEVYTLSNADNQHMWELGDVFEVFIQVEGRTDYVELHITPAGTRFHAHKPNVTGTDPITGEWQPIEHWLVTPIGFSAQSNRIENGWHATLQIPPTVLGLQTFEAGTELRIGFARYDGAPDQEPALSASAPHRIVSFHIPEDWHRVILE